MESGALYTTLLALKVGFCCIHLHSVVGSLQMFGVCLPRYKLESVYRATDLHNQGAVRGREFVGLAGRQMGVVRACVVFVHCGHLPAVIDDQCARHNAPLNEALKPRLNPL